MDYQTWWRRLEMLSTHWEWKHAQNSHMSCDLCTCMASDNGLSPVWKKPNYVFLGNNPFLKRNNRCEGSNMQAFGRRWQQGKHFCRSPTNCMGHNGWWYPVRTDLLVSNRLDAQTWPLVAGIQTYKRKDNQLGHQVNPLQLTVNKPVLVQRQPISTHFSLSNIFNRIKHLLDKFNVLNRYYFGAKC